MCVAYILSYFLGVVTVVAIEGVCCYFYVDAGRLIQCYLIDTLETGI